MEVAVERKERELDEVKATERVNVASKQALTSQVTMSQFASAVSS